MQFVVAIILPIVLLVVGNWYTAAIKEREVQGQFVKLAVDILQTAPTAGTKETRQWGINILNKYSGVPLAEEAQQALLEKSVLPSPRQRIEESVTLKNGDYKDFQMEGLFWINTNGAPGAGALGIADGNFAVHLLYKGERRQPQFPGWSEEQAAGKFCLFPIKEGSYPIRLLNNSGTERTFNIYMFK